MKKRDLQKDVEELRAKAASEKIRGREQSYKCLTKIADDIHLRIDLELAAKYEALAE